MKSKYVKLITFSYMYGESEPRIWEKYGKFIGRRRFNALMKDCFIDWRNLYLG